ncbi:polysaccharide pyruvyl transferase family protein [Sediminicoccus rosea]|uniref:Polysaccharide pyruvyl transferase family protein n=1 Tax=Sediminicoccus rosea TaxID=1225128 RepID=A0ABZ0PH06_9PROT|nr:polysaccharide pyruvyl transferase family protein [Sediminicoccus rosea]WPB84742.1 polysaccharide pyruvyl transferase family protein [Sediminicoccus rosea]
MATRVKFWLQDQAIGNFGDALALVYRDLMFTNECRFSHGTLYLVGSVIEPGRIKAAQRNGFKPEDGRGQAIFWGCGLQNAKPLSAELLTSCFFLGVRGAHSRDVLGLPKYTPLGDTALLLPRFYQPKHDPAVAGKVLWVHHLRHTAPTAEDLESCPDSVVMSPATENTTEACLRFIDAIASAKFVMANAMHAAIVALAYGVPFAFWSGTGVNYPFKWGDFTSGVGFELGFARSYAEGVALYDQTRPDRAWQSMNLDPLLKMAPFNLKV